MFCLCDLVDDMLFEGNQEQQFKEEHKQFDGNSTQVTGVRGEFDGNGTQVKETFFNGVEELQNFDGI